MFEFEDYLWENVMNRETAYQALIENKYRCPIQQGWNLVTHASFQGHVAILDALIIDFEKDPNAYDANGLTPLYAATIGNRVDAVKMLLRWGADPNLVCGKRRWTAIQAASTLGRASILALLKPQK